MKQNWKNIYKTQGYRAVYPSEYIIRFISKYFGKSNVPIKTKDFNNIKILDLGSGSGRHIIYLSNEGFQAYGIEQSFEGVEQTKKWLEIENLKAEVNTGSIENIQYSDETFDAVIDFQSIQHNNIEQINKIFKEIYRVLKKGGLLFSVLRSTKDYLSSVGKEVEFGTYKDIAEGDMLHAGICHFFTKEELKQLSKEFKILSIEESMRSVNNGKDFICEYLLTLKK